MAQTDADRIRSAYLRYLDAGHRMLRAPDVPPDAPLPGSTLAFHEEVELYPDEHLQTQYSQHLDLRIKGAYRASGSVVRGLYLHNNARKRPGRAVSGSCFSQPYEIYARRVPSGQDQTGVTSQEAWSRIETDQDPLRDSATDSLLPTSMVFPKALPLSHYPAKTRIIVAIRQSPVEMRTFINTGKLKIKVDIDRSDTWTQINPHVNVRLDRTNIWQVTREVHLKLGMGGDTYIVCSQIARLPDGTYVPWKKSEEDRLMRQGYDGYNFTGPYEPPSLLSGVGRHSRGGGASPLRLPPPPPRGLTQVVNHNVPPPPPFDADGNLVPLPWLAESPPCDAPAPFHRNPAAHGPPPPPPIVPRTGQLLPPQQNHARRDSSRHSPQCPLPPAWLPDARPNSYNIPPGLPPPPPPPSNLYPYISDPESPVSQIDNLLAGAL